MGRISPAWPALMVGLAGMMVGSWGLRQEICVAQADAQLKDLVQRTGMASVSPIADQCTFHPPARARASYALALAVQAQRLANGPARHALLSRASVHSRAMLAANDQWAEAHVIAAFIASLRPLPNDQDIRQALIRSYRLAPFLPGGTGWRMQFGLAHWSRLPPDVQGAVANETVAIARLDPVRKPAIFEMVRSSAGYAAFLTRWHVVRSQDADRARATPRP